MGAWFHRYCRSVMIMIAVYGLLVLVAMTALTQCSSVANAAPPTKDSSRSKFYDFSDQLINGEIRKPTNLYIDSRKKVRFERLLKLKKSFLPDLFDTSKEKVFK